MKLKKCNICGNKKANIHFKVKEMMFGLLDEFDYFQCFKCRCLQIAEIPKNLSDYYPKNYYSYELVNENFLNKQPRKFFRDLKNNYSIFKKGLFGKLLNCIYPNSAYGFLSNITLSKESSILDIGCGNGIFLYGLKCLGFNNLKGIDPFIKEKIKYKNNLQIFKKSIFQIKEKFDLIILNHSFEHMASPCDVISKISKLLNNNGVCVIRTPTIDSYSWEIYKENWVQLDAPRHLFIHSFSSLKLMTEINGLKISNFNNDSDSFQFWGSEQYLKKISLYSSVSFLVNPSKSIFNKCQIKSFEKKAKNLNKNLRGDQAVYYINKKNYNG